MIECHPTPDAELAEHDLPALIDRCMGDCGLALMLLERFYDRLWAKTEKIQNAIAAADMTLGTSLTHSLKGEAASLEIKQLCATVEALEVAMRANDPTVLSRLDALRVAAERSFAEYPTVIAAIDRFTCKPG